MTPAGPLWDPAPGPGKRGLFSCERGRPSSSLRPYSGRHGGQPGERRPANLWGDEGSRLHGSPSCHSTGKARLSGARARVSGSGGAVGAEPDVPDTAVGASGGLELGSVSAAASRRRRASSIAQLAKWGTLDSGSIRRSISPVGGGDGEGISPPAQRRVGPPSLSARSRTGCARHGARLPRSDRRWSVKRREPTPRALLSHTRLRGVAYNS